MGKPTAVMPQGGSFLLYDGKAGDDFWVKAETLLYTALIGYIHYEAPVEEQNFSTLIEFINAMEVREDDEDFKNPVDLMFDELKKRKPDHFAVRQYAKFKLSAGKTAKSILISCGARLAPFDIQELIASRRRKRRNGTTQIFAGLIKCADCGWSLAYGENKQNKNPYGYYHCSKNGQGLRQCSMHYIRYDVLYALSLIHI